MYPLTPNAVKLPKVAHSVFNNQPVLIIRGTKRTSIAFNLTLPAQTPIDFIRTLNRTDKIRECERLAMHAGWRIHWNCSLANPDNWCLN